MDRLITMTCWSTIFVLSALLILTGMRGMGETIPQARINILASTMYALFVITSLFVLYREYKAGNKSWLFLFALPLDVLLISLILPYFNIKMHSSILFLFDVYVLILFSYYLGVRRHNDGESIVVTTSPIDEN